MSKKEQHSIVSGDAGTHVNLVVAKDESSIEIGGYNLRLDLLDGWEALSDPQQRYLALYAKDPDQKTATAMALGYPMSRVQNWFSQDSFSKVTRQINDLYTEFLKGVDYKEAIYNHKVRGRVLKARKAEGYHDDSKKESKHLHLHGSFKDVMALLDGKGG